MLYAAMLERTRVEDNIYHFMGSETFSAYSRTRCHKNVTSLCSAFSATKIRLREGSKWGLAYEGSRYLSHDWPGAPMGA